MKAWLVEGLFCARSTKKEQESDVGTLFAHQIDMVYNKSDRFAESDENSEDHECLTLSSEVLMQV